MGDTTDRVGIELQQVAFGTLKLGENDILVLMCQDRLSADALTRVRERVESVIGDANRVMVIDSRYLLGVIERTAPRYVPPIPVAADTVCGDCRHFRADRRAAPCHWCRKLLREVDFAGTCEQFERKTAPAETESQATGDALGASCAAAVGDRGTG